MNEILIKAIKGLAHQYQEILNLSKKYPNDSDLGKHVRISIESYISNKEINKDIESKNKK
jgi:hypothetical protein